MLISIIVPVYNVQKYIDECINSILGQECKDYELILVDDGSTDDSGKICDYYAKNNEKISVLHKENGGLSDARNAGIQVAKGDYILFVDSDDYIGKGSLMEINRCLIEQKQMIDVVFLEAIKFYPDGTEMSMGDGYIVDNINGQPKEKVMQHLAELPKFPGSACTKLVRREMIMNSKLFFEKGLLSEDIEWTIRLLKEADTFAYCSVPYYYYRQKRAGSITNTSSKINLVHLLSTIKKFASKNMGIPYQKEINSFCAYEYIVVLVNYAALKAKDKSILYKEVNELKWILKYSIPLSGQKLYVILQIIGVRGTSIMLKLYRNCNLRYRRWFGTKS